MRSEKQLFNYLKSRVMNKKFYWLAGFAALMMTAACSDDNVVNENPTPDPEPEVESNVVTLQVIDGASQAGRIHMVPQTKAVSGVKKNRLNYVATISHPELQADEKNWSATSVFVENEESTSHTVYITWHSDRQATDPAVTWGGALDVVAFQEEIEDETVTDISLEDSYYDPQNLMKFEGVMKVEKADGNYGALFVSATHATKGAVVARLPMYNPANAEIIGMPGASVNCVAQMGENLVAVTGFRGTWATFSPDVAAVDYDYENLENNDWLTLKKDMSDDFGGKYIAVDEHNRGYVLRTELNKAQIIGASTGRVVVDDMAPLLSSNKVGETYDPTTGDWTLGTEESPLQGKHVMVVKDDYAYVGAGLNGLRVYSLSNGTEVKNFDEEKGGPNTTGLCIDGDLLYAATGSGLRVYKMLGEGQLELYAFEVKEYDANGLPNSNEPPTTIDDGTATPGHHFANFVTVLNAEDGNKYIFVAYGQDGVRVYKLIPDATGEEEEVTE